MPATSTPANTSPASLEHVNLTVVDLEATLAFIQTALPDWRVRGQGSMDWFGTPIRWLHVGTDHQYLALQSGGQGPAMDWQTHTTGVKHLGFVVPSVDAVLQRLTDAGHPLDHWGADDARRRSVYFMLAGAVQFEFVEYGSNDPALKNVYPAN